MIIIHSNDSILLNNSQRNTNKILLKKRQMQVFVTYKLLNARKTLITYLAKSNMLDHEMFHGQ